jgi:hypothetical protein
MVVRTQVSLEADLHRRAKRRAADLGVSFAEYVRRVVDRDLGEEPPRGDISAIFDLGDSGGSDIARHKERYLDEAAVSEWERETGRDSHFAVYRYGPRRGRAFDVRR